MKQEQARIVVYSGATFEQMVAILEAERKADAARCEATEKDRMNTNAPA